MRYISAFLIATLFITTGTMSVHAETNNRTKSFLPENKRPLNLIDILSIRTEFTTLSHLFQIADLGNILNNKGPFTMFAPSDSAFEKLPPGFLDDLSKPENKEKLRFLLMYHIVPGLMTKNDLMTMNVKTVNGEDIDIESAGKTFMVDNAKIIRMDIFAVNGVIQIIDTVLIPAGFDK